MSSAIERVGYDPLERILRIQFATGLTYEYEGVPRPVYEEFLEAGSLGEFFNRRIRDRYPYRRVF